MIKTCVDCVYSEKKIHMILPPRYFGSYTSAPLTQEVMHCNFHCQLHIDIVSGRSTLQARQIPTCKASRESEILCGEAAANWVRA
jgi:hypothetical protein